MLWNRLHVWRENLVICYRTLAGEFWVVNVEFSNLWYLMNALWPACLAQVLPPNPLPQSLTIPAMQASEALLRLVHTSDRVGDGDEVIIRRVELYDPVKTVFWFSLHLCHSRSSENRVVRVASRSKRTKLVTKSGNMHCDWFILLLLLIKNLVLLRS